MGYQDVSLTSSSSFRGVPYCMGLSRVEESYCFCLDFMLEGSSGGFDRKSNLTGPPWAFVYVYDVGEFCKVS